MALPRVLQPHQNHFFLLGPRGTGKSTWLRTVFPDAVVVDLLDPQQEREYLARPERLGDLVRAHGRATVVIVDEVQKVPALLNVVHQLIEEGGRQRNRSGSPRGPRST